MWRTRWKTSQPSASKEKEEFACVNCQAVSKSTYTKYSEDGIRLTDCETCKGVVDKYIEYDVVLVVIDLMLQYIQAYRHLLLNVRIQRPERLFVIFWLSHAAEVWIRDNPRNKESTGEQVADQEWMFYRCLLHSAIEICTFVFIVLLFSMWKSKETRRSTKQIIGSTLLGYYGNVAVVISFIFNLSHHDSYQIVMKIFLMVSHIQVQRVLFPAVSRTNNTIVVLVAMLFSFITGHLLTTAVL